MQLLFKERIEMNKKIKWNVKPLTLPTIIKNCPKCGNNKEFESSNNFRVNANKNNLDVWLIYQCKKCKATWNMDILSRVSPESIDQETYNRFLANDLDLAIEYAFNIPIHSKNKVTLNYENLQYEILGDNVDLNDNTILEIDCSFPLDIRIDKLLSEKLAISRSQIKKLCKNNIITIDNINEPWKAKLKNKVELYINSN